MKNRFIAIIVICLAVIVAVTALACREKKTETAALTPMSEVRLEGHVLTWDAVDDAAFYTVKVLFDEHNGFEIPVSGTRHPLALYEEGTYTLSVRPVFAEGYGAYSPALTYTIEKEVVVTPSEDGKVVLRGAGTYEDPILIYTKEELASLTDGKRSVTENGETVKLQNYYRLMNDIDLSGEEWISIGSSANRFEGLFDGNGHTIKGLTQTKLNSKSSRYNCGLFAELGKATIVNLTLTDVNISLGLVNEEFRIGGIAGYSVGATIENCRVSGNITVNSPQSTQKAAHVGMLLGYSNGTDVRRVETGGTIDATYAKIYAGGVEGMCTSASLDVLNDVASYVNVKAHGTGRKDNQAAGRAYAAGIAYLSNVSSVANVVWLGTASATAVVGTPADEEYYAEGMFVVGGDKLVRGQSQVTIEDCFFDVDGLAYDEDAYSLDKYNGDETARLNAIANRYATGNAQSQKRTSSVYGVNAATRTLQASYTPQEEGVTFGLDFDAVWTMTEEAAAPVALQPYRSQWYTVTFVADDGTTVSTQRILKGRAANPPEYVGAEGVTVKWDIDAAAPITEDIVVRPKHAE